jgi:putative transposase
VNTDELAHAISVAEHRVLEIQAKLTCGAPGAWKQARRVREAAWGNGPVDKTETAPQADFTVDCAVTLQRIYVFLVIELNTRYVHILGTTTNPDGPWTTQQARNLVTELGERAAEFRFLIRDRAGQFTASFDSVFADAGIQAVKIPPRCPQANAFAERFVRTVPAELTDRMLIFGQRHLRHMLSEYARHYNRQRPHRGQQLRPPQPEPPVLTDNVTEIVRRPNLGNLINEYHIAA